MIQLGFGLFGGNEGEIRRWILERESDVVVFYMMVVLMFKE